MLSDLFKRPGMLGLDWGLGLWKALLAIVMGLSSLCELPLR